MAGKNKKICMATLEFPPEQWGGLARTAGKVSQYAVDLGLDVHVAHFSVRDNDLVLLDENRQTFHRDGLTVHQITLGKQPSFEGFRELWDCPHNLTLQMMYQSLEKVHALENFDLLHALFLYPVGYVCGLLAKRLDIPCLLTIVGNDIKKYVFSPEKVGACRSGLENAGMIVALSKDLMEMADAVTPTKDKTRVIYNSVEIQGDCGKASIMRSTRFKIGCAGIFKYAKGLPYLFKAVSALKDRRPIRLELLGTLRDSEKELYEIMLAKTGIGDIMHLLDPLPRNGVLDWLRELDAFVLPSLTEGCPNILMEAMAVGLPTIATRTGAVEELVEEGVSGLLVPWGDSGALASALLQIIDDPGLGQSLASEAKARMGLFSPEVEKKEWQEVYRQILGGSRS